MPLGRLAILMLMFDAGLNAPSLPSLPLFTCARPTAGSPAASTVTQKMIEESFTPPARRCIASCFISKLLSRNPSVVSMPEFLCPPPE
jgi:hypothetical protein